MGSNRERNGQPLLDCGQETERSEHLPGLPITRQPRIVHRVLASAVLAAHVR